jgi:hypothetical protein
METKTIGPSWYARPLSKKASRIFSVAAIGGLIVYEGWLGRWRIIAGDVGFLISFALFALASVVLSWALRRVSGLAREAQNQVSFGRLQMTARLLSAVCMIGVWTFSDYTLRRFDLDSLTGSIFLGIVFGLWNGATLKQKPLANN